MNRRYLLLSAAIGASALSACESTSVSTVWKSPAPPPERPFDKVVALVINATPGERRAAEDALVSAIPDKRGVPAYSFLPDDALTSRERIREVLLHENIDGAAVLRLVSSDKQSRVVEHAETTRGHGMYDRYGTYPMYRTSSSTITDTYFYAEFSVFDVREDRLLWTGETTTVNPDGVQGLVREVAKAVEAELRKQGLLK